MIDNDGYRLNIGIVLANDEHKLFWGKRISICQSEAWQFPQGGICAYETLKEAMYRELTEETGLTESDVEILKITRRWFYYQLPSATARKLSDVRDRKRCIGQRQRWFLLKLISAPEKICFDKNETPEFSDWCWVDYWYPVQNVVSFKREVYAQVLSEFEPVLFNHSS